MLAGKCFESRIGRFPRALLSLARHIAGQGRNSEMLLSVQRNMQKNILKLLRIFVVQITAVRAHMAWGKHPIICDVGALEGDTPPVDLIPAGLQEFLSQK